MENLLIIVALTVIAIILLCTTVIKESKKNQKYLWYEQDLLEVIRKIIDSEKSYEVKSNILGIRDNLILNAFEEKNLDKKFYAYRDSIKRAEYILKDAAKFQVLLNVIERNIFLDKITSDNAKEIYCKECAEAMEIFGEDIKSIDIKTLKIREEYENIFKLNSRILRNITFDPLFLKAYGAKENKNLKEQLISEEGIKSVICKMNMSEYAVNIKPLDTKKERYYFVRFSDKAAKEGIELAKNPKELNKIQGIVKGLSADFYITDIQDDILYAMSYEKFINKKTLDVMPIYI